MRKPETLFVIYYDETEKIADNLINMGYDVDKLYMNAQLKDDNSIVFDEMKLRYDNIVIDGHLTEQVVRFSHLNHGHYYFLFYEGKDKLDQEILKADYMVVKVKDYEIKTENDWAEASILFGESLSKSIISDTNIRT